MAKPLNTFLCAALCALSLVACESTAPKLEETPAAPATPVTRDISLLFDAPVHTTLSCRSTQPLSVKNPFKTILFECGTFDVQVSIVELQDAGWRTETVEIGEPTTIDGVVSMPLNITVKKLF